MKKTMTLILLISTVFLTACETDPNAAPKEATHHYNKQCLQGVAYWKGHKKFAPVFKSDSTVETCDVENEETKDASRIYHKQCLQGVVYWKGLKKLAPVFKTDSTVETCGQYNDSTTSSGLK